MLIGYARVSTQDQDSSAQMATLEKTGCERIFQETASGGRWDRPVVAFTERRVDLDRKKSTRLELVFVA